MSQFADVATFRAQGPRGLASWIQHRGRAASPELDQLCKQKDAHTALLYWFTDLSAAIAEAKQTGKPILSLRLLGNLDEELSCANSRFFRKLLYPEANVNRILRERFVLHWQSVRAVPIVTIDFGGGKKIQKTITGNSVHLVLDTAGRPVDALPGLMKAETFAQKLLEAERAGKGERKHLARHHEEHLRSPYQPPPAMPAPSRAVAASAIAMTKHMVEMPLLRAVEPLELDDLKNQALHERVRQAFAYGYPWQGGEGGVDGFVAWIYAELFLMPLSDPALGLDVADPFGDAQASVAQPTAPRPPPAPVQKPATAMAPGKAPSPVRRWASTIARALT